MKKMRAHTLVYAASAAILATACQGDLTAAPISSTDEPVTATSSSNPLASFTFYIDQASKARRTADSWRGSRPADANQMEKIASQPTAKCFGSWNSTSSIRNDVAGAVSAIAGSESVPVFVAYNIPQRDCGGLSGSNTLSVDGYRTWISEFARGLGQSEAVVVLEPDALAAMSCLSDADQHTRVDLIKYALDALR